MRIIFCLTCLALVFSSLACVSADSLTRDVGMQAYEQQVLLKQENQRTGELQAERARLKSRLSNYQSRERALLSDGATLAEQAELAKVRQEIQNLKQTLAKLAAAG
jgi:Skp family chaperone for outer membrane proteins